MNEVIEGEIVGEVVQQPVSDVDILAQLNAMTTDKGVSATEFKQYMDKQQAAHQEPPKPHWKETQSADDKDHMLAKAELKRLIKQLKRAKGSDDPEVLELEAKYRGM